ncbi:chymotrypsinogen A-like isoform X2 [Ruditapes philippinarum]|uniref:chymotrypsinogen A-like isoform X1 n=1 Tax=Ruditapes philippinarum TaxID=129788 RepID=UPI00295AACD2|nr:chymotrypsinogen A-like isoform X1 [Ruditapes philippinarum]XP_060570947.1 chymotrypsinogen A-like isoform X2 [Ruditapes philippinarum]
MLKLLLCVLFSGSLFAASIDTNAPSGDDNGTKNREVGRLREEKHRIVGGNFADKGEYPWLIVLRYGGRFRCGGTIINPTTIITAAHCVTKKRKRYYEIVAGDYKVWEKEKSEQKIRVRKILKHPMYGKEAKFNNDIAILKLSKRLRYNKFVKPLRVISNEDMEETLFSNCVAAGIGDVDNFSTTPTRTKEVRVNIQPNSTCALIATVKYWRLFTNSMLCSKDRLQGVCSGDSGGPLICYGDTAQTISNAYLVGVVSFGDANCFVGFNVYARVSQFINWIENNS